MKILVIAPIFYPYNNPRAFRWTAIAKAWHQLGHDVHILTSKGPDGKSDFLEIKGIKVHRIFYNSLKEILIRTNQSQHYQASTKKNITNSFSSKFIQYLNQFFWKKIFFPDDACIWYLPALNLARRLHKKYDYNLVISVSLPFTSHLIGKNLKQKYPKLNWVIDIGDPFSLQEQHPINNYFLFNYFNRKLERKTLELATLVSVTNEGCKQLYLNQFDGLNADIKVIPPLYCPVKQHQNRDLTLDQGKIHLAYFGRFFPKIREPLDAFQLIALAINRYPQPSNQLQIHFFGEGFEAYQSTFKQFPKLSNRMVFHGLVSRKKAAAYMQKMDFLINFGNATSFQLPSKSVDYMASGKPIINFQITKQDTFKTFFKNYPHIINLLVSEKNWEEENIRTFVSFLWGMKRKKLSTIQIEKLIAPFSPDSIARQYL